MPILLRHFKVLFRMAGAVRTAIIGVWSFMLSLSLPIVHVVFSSLALCILAFPHPFKRMVPPLFLWFCSASSGCRVLMVYCLLLCWCFSVLFVLYILPFYVMCWNYFDGWLILIVTKLSSSGRTSLIYVQRNF